MVLVVFHVEQFPMESGDVFQWVAIEMSGFRDHFIDNAFECSFTVFGFHRFVSLWLVVQLTPKNLRAASQSSVVRMK